MACPRWRDRAIAIVGWRGRGGGKGMRRAQFSVAPFEFSDAVADRRPLDQASTPAMDRRGTVGPGRLGFSVEHVSHSPAPKRAGATLLPLLHRGMDPWLTKSPLSDFFFSQRKRATFFLCFSRLTKLCLVALESLASAVFGLHPKIFFTKR